MILMSRKVRVTMLVSWLLMLCAVPVFAKSSGKSAVGTWKLDTNKSSYNNVPAPKFEQLVVATDEPKALKWALSGATADGKTYNSSYDGPIDSQYHPVVSSEGQETVAYTRTPDGGVKWTVKDKSGEVIETGISQLSADGNTLTLKGILNGPNGKGNFVSVFTKAQ
jgi:hypothetical protein